MLSRQRQLLVASAPIIFVLLWSTGYLSSRIIRPYVEPLSFSALRFAAASVIFIALVFARGGKWPSERSDWWHLVVLLLWDFDFVSCWRWCRAFLTALRDR